MSERTSATEGGPPSVAAPSPVPTASRGTTVLYLLSEYPVLSQTFVRNEIEGLRGSGLDVEVVAVRTPGEPAAGGPYAPLRAPALLAVLAAHVWVVTRRPRSYLAFLRQLFTLRGAGARLGVTAVVPLVAGLLRQGGLAAVHTHFAWGAAPLTLYAGALAGARTSVTVHANDIYHPVFDLTRVLPRFDTLVTVCRYNVDYCEERGFAPAGMVIVPCGVEVPATADLPDPRPGVVVSVGRLVPKKGFLSLVTAFREVVDHVPNARLEIVGEGPDRAVIEAKVAELGLGDSVVLHGAMPHAGVLDLLAGTDVFVLACEPEPDGSADALPVAIREAMARARPVVSTRLAGIPEAVGDTGRIVTPGDVAALAAAVTELLADRTLADGLGARARARILDHATLAHTVRGMRQVLLPALGTAAPVRAPGVVAARPVVPAVTEVR